jgi:hypothetical protein
MSEEDKKQLIIDYTQTFEISSGRRVLADLKRLSKIDGYLNLASNKDITAIQVAFAEGQRSVMMHIYAQLKKDPYAVKQIKAINYEREEEDG